MKLALIYIAVIIFTYVFVDTAVYVLFMERIRELFKLRKRALGAENPDEALELAKSFNEEINSWSEKERRLEYKSVWVGNRYADGLEDLVEKWRGTWPEETIAELTKTAEMLRNYYPQYLWALTKAVAIAILLALFIRAFLVQAFKIPSGSMIPTLYVGDQLLVNKFKYGIENPFTGKRLINLWEPKRGDIVVFRPPRSVESSWMTHTIDLPFTKKTLFSWRYQVDFIKRIVGLPGDTVETRDGILYVNGQEMKLTPLKEFDYKKKYGTYVRTVETEVYEEQIDGKKHLIIHDSPEAMRGDNFGPITVAPGQFFAMGDNRDDSADSRTWTGDPAHLEDIRGKAFIIHFSWDPVENHPRLDRVGKLIH